MSLAAPSGSSNARKVAPMAMLRMQQIVPLTMLSLGMVGQA